jgi:LmbE family N-acetylglucosaminyl deacetylase
MKFKNLFLIVAILMTAVSSFTAHQPAVMNGAELKIALKKLLNLGSVLYIAAHPDDENTAVLAYMSNERLMRTGYLSLTRGGGGQNLIGSEKGPLMSVLRTHELLQARGIDKAEQFFTRAVDFGYSKTAKESLAIWGKENILADMVYIIRKFQPDVLLTRFGNEKRYGGHGHHTASAILAMEAFHAAGDKSRFPEQLKHVSVWQPKRILWNTWKPYLKDAKPEETARLLAVDVGVYNSLLGMSYYEIASLSRSMHKSQGFGSVPRRGSRLDYFEHLAGTPANNDLFEGIDTSWKRVPGSTKIQELLEQANQSFQAEEPQKILPLLLDALSQLESLPGSYWTRQKTKELKEVIRSCGGLWLEAIAQTHTVTPGSTIKVTGTVINRSGFPFTFKKIILPGASDDLNINAPLKTNTPLSRKFTMPIVESRYTHPFWLKESPERGLYRSANHGLRGLAAAPYTINVKILLEWGGKTVSFDTPVLYRWRDPVEGERVRGLTVTPPVTANFSEQVYYFAGNQPQTIGMILRSGPEKIAGKLKPILPAGWKAKPAEMPFSISEPLTEQKVFFEISPAAGAGNAPMIADMAMELQVGEKTYRRARISIEYPHLPEQVLHPEAAARLVRVDIERNGKKLGYIMGSGDDIPRYLEQVGYQIDILEDGDLFDCDLSVYDAVITGVRAYNTRDVLKHVQQRLMDYVSSGGRLVVQYNVNRGLTVPQLGPYSFRISRNRVTEEDAAVSLIKPDHPLLNHPNKIRPEDFNGWVQERGLYFADQWAPEFTPVLACNDEGETPQKGGLLVARYGKGTFIYTGYSFFRQLPAGVPGALKLFVNLLSKSN